MPGSNRFHRRHDKEVIVSLPEKDAAESEIELAAVTDLYEEEVDYYMNLENK